MLNFFFLFSEFQIQGYFLDSKVSALVGISLGMVGCTHLDTIIQYAEARRS